jgi:hypothetical protein
VTPHGASDTLSDVTFEDLESTMPEGLHDAVLAELNLNYPMRELVLLLQVRAGEDRYRRVRVRIKRLQFCVIDPPDARYPYNEAGARFIEAGAGQPPASEVALPEPLVDGAFLFWLYIKPWNSYIRIAGCEARTEWID